MKLSDYRTLYSMKASKINRFVGSDSEFDENTVKQWLTTLLNANNIFNKRIIDITDYEKLIFVSYKFKECEEIQQLLEKIFLKISSNYIERKKYINKV